MYNPDDFNKNEQKNENTDTPNTQSNYDWQQPSSSNQQNWQSSNQTYWQGSSYHSSSQQNDQNQHTWSSTQPANSTHTAPNRDKKKSKKTGLKIIAGVLCCLLISAGSIGGFVALINNGYVTINNTAAGNNSPISITKVVDQKAEPVSATSKMTPQQIAKKVIPSVVCIQNYQVSEYQNFGLQNTKEGVNPAGEGSGIIATKDGYIITNAHVVNGATSLKVILSDGKKYEAKLIGMDVVTDLALIKIDAPNLSPAEFGSSDDLQVADTVMAIGNPGGMELNSSVTIGYISALNREIVNDEAGYTMKCIQTDAAINPGNSGGALVNLYGQVIGINSSKIVASGYEGLGFAIPINNAQPIIANLKQYGYVKDRAVLGITGQYVDSMTSRFYGLPVGMYIASINNKSILSAGIQKGDVITKIDNQEIRSENSIMSLIRQKKPGDSVTLSITRPSTGKTFTASVALSEFKGQ